MIRNHLVKLILPVACSLSLSHAVIRKIPLLETNQPVPQSIGTFYNYNYKGIYAINEYGWYIRQKWDTPLQEVQLSGKWYQIKDNHTFNHPYLPFSIFKVDVGNDAQRDSLPKLLRLATKADLQSDANWVASLSFVPDPFSHEGRISESRAGYTGPLSVISKVEKQEGNLLYLSPGGSANRFCHESWSQFNQKYEQLYSRNSHHINGLLNDPAYQRNFLTQNGSELAQTKRTDLEKQKEDLTKGYLDLLSRTCKSPIDQQANLNHFSGSPAMVDIDKKVGVLRSSDLTLEKESLLSEDLKKLWEDHQKTLIAERERYLDRIRYVESFSDNYGEIDLNKQRVFKRDRVLSFRSSHLGVASKKDKGGLILVDANKLTFKSNQYGFNKLVAGITWFKKDDDFVEGETSVAIDLTTPEVHEWVSNVIDAYYAPQDSAEKGKRSAEDEAGPSDERKRPRIKEETTNNDIALNPHNVQIKEEVKNEFKQEN